MSRRSRSSLSLEDAMFTLTAPVPSRKPPPSAGADAEFEQHISKFEY